MPEGSPQSRYVMAAGGSVGAVPGHDGVLDRNVRVLLASAAEADALERTARRLARIEHAGIAVVYDFVRDEAGARLVMGRIDGVLLSSAIADAREGLVRPELADAAAALGLMVRVCDALAAAHEQGIAHRSVRTSLITIGRHCEMEIGGWEDASEGGSGLDDPFADIRAVGACVFEVLVLRPPTPGGDPFRDLSPAEEIHVPPGTAALVRRALASDVANGYRSIGELRGDLARICGSLRVAAHAAAAPPRLGRRARRALAAAFVLLALGAGGFAVWRFSAAPSAPAEVGWGEPSVREDFSDDGWHARWRAPSADLGAMWVVRNKRLVSTAPGPATLVFRQRLSVPLAIEYTGQILPGERPGDLSVLWSEDEAQPPGESQTLTQAQRTRSYRIQAGGQENSYCGIFRDPDGQRLAYAARQLKPGIDHRFRVEIDVERMTLFIDGQRVVEHRERFATTSGHLALYGHFPGKAFSDVTIQGRPSTAQDSTLAMGDMLFTLSHFADAAAIYARVVEGSAPERMIQEALFRKGLAERRAGQLDASRETWSQLLDPALAQTADAIRLEELLDTGQDELFRDRLAAFWRHSPAAHDELRRQWQTAAGREIAAARSDPGRAEALLNLRSGLFPDDATSAYEVANLLMRLGRYEQVLKEHADERRSCIPALLALGRPDEAERTGWLVPMDQVTLHMMRGTYGQLAVTPDAPVYFKAFALCKAGRAAEVVGAFSAHPAKLHLGRAVELLTDPKMPDRVISEALVALGRLEEAAGSGLAGRPGSGRFSVALALLGRIAEAEAEAESGQPMPALRLIAALEAGDQAAARQARAELKPPRNRSQNTGWFPGMVLAPFTDRLAGEAGPLDAALQTMADGWSGVYANRARIFAGAVLGRLDAAAVLAQPTVSEASAWLALAQALRAEREGRVVEARQAYAAFVALPMHQRLLADNSPDATIENFVAWRLRALGR